MVGTLGRGISVASGISDPGTVVGWSETPSFETHGFLYTPVLIGGKLADIASSYAIARKISDLGRIVGVDESTGNAITMPKGKPIVQVQEPRLDEPQPVARIRRVSTGYFDAVGTPLTEGCAFNAADRDTTERVAIIDQTVAQRYWRGSSALGRRISMSTSGGEPVWRRLVLRASSVNIEAAPSQESACR